MSLLLQTVKKNGVVSDQELSLDEKHADDLKHIRALLAEQEIRQMKQEAELEEQRAVMAEQREAMAEQREAMMEQREVMAAMQHELTLQREAAHTAKVQLKTGKLIFLSFLSSNLQYTIRVHVLAYGHDVVELKSCKRNLTDYVDRAVSGGQSVAPEGDITDPCETFEF